MKWIGMGPFRSSYVTSTIMARFFGWCYQEGLAEWAHLWGNLGATLWRFLNIPRLFITLVAPWRRDVTFAYGTGFHPLRMLNRLAENIISRFMGMLVRMAVILTGVVALLFFVLLTVIMLIAWLLWPLLFLVASAMAFFGDPLWWGACVVFLVAVAFSAWSMYRRILRSLSVADAGGWQGAPGSGGSGVV